MYHVIKIDNFELHLDSLKTQDVRKVSYTNCEAKLLIDYIIDICATSKTRESNVSRGIILAHIYALSYLSDSVSNEKETFNNIIITYDNKQYADCLKFFIVEHKDFYYDVYNLCKHLYLSIQQINDLPYWEFKTLANITKKEIYERRRKDREDLDRN